MGGRAGQNKTRVNLTNILLKSHWLNTLKHENLRHGPKNIKVCYTKIYLKIEECQNLKQTSCLLISQLKMANR